MFDFSVLAHTDVLVRASLRSYEELFRERQNHSMFGRLQSLKLACRNRAPYREVSAWSAMRVARGESMERGRGCLTQ